MTSVLLSYDDQPDSNILPHNVLLTIFVNVPFSAQISLSVLILLTELSF